MKILVLLFILSFNISVFGQKNVSSLNPVHAAALEKFLSAHKEYNFLPETQIDAKTLKSMREIWGKNFHPYYATGDFNHDKRLDFALVLSKEGTPTTEEGTEIVSYPLALVIFNNTGKGYRKAFLEDVEFPLESLLIYKYKKLQFGVYESDAGFFLTAAGKGYIKEYSEEP